MLCTKPDSQIDEISMFQSIIVQFFLAGLFFSTTALADSSSPRLAGFYDSFLAICGNKVYEWDDFNQPQERMSGIRQVEIGKENRYALTDEGELLTWKNGSPSITTLMEDVQSFSAGRSGLLVIKNDSSLWAFEAKSFFGFGEEVSQTPLYIANDVVVVAVGDSADYYVTLEGDLFVKGQAHRGQYGDGKLTATENFVQTSGNVAQVVSHTGHTLLLKRDGTVWGTGGNIYGPLGHHGYGDKAIEWGLVFKDANAIATGSSHSVAIKHDRSLWIWGRNEGLDPRQVMTEVEAVAAGNSSTLALSKNALWQWDTGKNPARIMTCQNR